MRKLDEIIDELMKKAEFNKNGKMGYECYVEKSLLKEAAIYLQEYKDRLDGEV